MRVCFHTCLLLLWSRVHLHNAFLIKVHVFTTGEWCKRLCWRKQGNGRIIYEWMEPHAFEMGTTTCAMHAVLQWKGRLTPILSQADAWPGPHWWYIQMHWVPLWHPFCSAVQQSWIDVLQWNRCHEIAVRCSLVVVSLSWESSLW